MASRDLRLGRWLPPRADPRSHPAVGRGGAASRGDRAPRRRRASHARRSAARAPHLRADAPQVPGARDGGRRNRRGGRPERDRRRARRACRRRAHWGRGTRVACRCACCASRADPARRHLRDRRVPDDLGGHGLAGTRPRGDRLPCRQGQCGRTHPARSRDRCVRGSRHIRRAARSAARCRGLGHVRRTQLPARRAPRRRAHPRPPHLTAGRPAGRAFRRGDRHRRRPGPSRTAAPRRARRLGGARGRRRRARPRADTSHPQGGVPAKLLELTAEGRITPVVEREYPFDEASAALAHLEAGHTVGKVVVHGP